MAKVSSRSVDAISDLDLLTKNIRRYLESASQGFTEPVFTNETDYGLLVGYGAGQHMLSPYYNGAAANQGALLSGLLSFEELKALKIQKPQPVVANLVFEGETVLIAGRPKVGKSRLVHQMALAIVNGSEFLGMDVPKPRPVLILDLENPRWAIRDRLLRMGGDKDPARGLFVWCAHSLAAAPLNPTSEGIERTQELLRHTGAEVVFVDPWRLWLGGDENKAEDIVNGLRALSRLRELNPRLTIGIIHHVRKDRFESPHNLLADPRLWIESVSGHYALASHVDACFGLERQRDKDGEEWIAFGGIARNTEPNTILLEDEEESLCFSVRGGGDAVLETILTKKEREIWKIAVKLGDFGFNELVSHSAGKNRKAVSSMLKRAQGQRLITRTEKGYAVVKMAG